MRLPNPDRAIIQQEKLQDYLLSPTHVLGRHKAAFFRSLGYTSDEWMALERDLRGLLNARADRTEITPYGRKYRIRGPITGPSGITAVIVTVWIVLHGEEVARFVTAFPEG
jgi:hypothetical protein